MKKLFTLLACLLMLAACSEKGISQADFDKVMQERDELAVQVEDLQSQLEAMQNTGVYTLPPSTTDGRGPVATPSKPVGAFDAGAIAENLIVRQYSYTDSWRELQVFHVVENTSEYTLEITGSLKTFNSSGDLIGAKSSSESPIGPGQKTILSYWFDEAFTSSEYEMTVSEDTWYAPITQNLSYVSSSAKNKEVITVTNNGDIAAEDVVANVLFFSGETLVYYNYEYFTDNDSTLNPGKSITRELNCDQSYDSFVVIFAGHA